MEAAAVIYRAYFISPAGNIIKIEGSHIGHVIDNPDLFGLAIEDITMIYHKYNEPLGFEGKARHEILVRIIAQGWVRIRRYKEHWSITVNSLTEETRARLKKWGEHIDDFPYAPVLINDLRTGTKYQYRLQNLYNKCAESG